MHRHRLSVLAFASVLMLGGAAACGSSGSDSSATTGPTTTAVSPTTVATTVATTAPVATTTTAAATTAPPSTVAATTSTTVVAPAGASTPEDAAKGLYAAWKVGDKTAAATFAEPAAIDTLFARTYTGPDLQFIGCEPDGDVYACTWYYEGGAETYRTTGSATAGYKVVAITELAD